MFRHLIKGEFDSVMKIIIELKLLWAEQNEHIKAPYAVAKIEPRYVINKAFEFEIQKIIEKKIYRVIAGSERCERIFQL